MLDRSLGYRTRFQRYVMRYVVMCNSACSVMCSDSMHIHIHMYDIAMEQEVAKLGGKYCIGDDVTLADVCLVPQMYNARR